MKVLYELDLNDIIRIVADKYEVNPAKIKKINKDGLNYLTVDMSTTETPGEVKVEYSPISPEFLKKVLEERDKRLERNKTTEQKEPEKKEEAEEVSDDVAQELQYKKITDEELMKGINDGLKVRDICIAMGLKDKKYSQRLYTRVGNLKKELVKPTTEEQKAILKSLKKEQTKTKMPGIDGDIIVYTCPVCGKEFDTEKYPQYAYKKRVFNHNHVFCGYDCMRKAEKALTPEG